MTEQQIRRELRLLKGYALVTTVMITILTLGAFRRNTAHEKFTEIDVERINVMEPDGKYRMVISNRPRSIGPIYKGKPFGYKGGTRPGIIFFNDEGTENGGLTFQGTGSAERPDASTHMSFDQFNSDQVLNLDYADRNGKRTVGISMLDRAPADIYDFVQARDSIMQLSDSAARSAALRKLAAPRNGVPFVAQRVFLGRDSNKAAILSLADQNGKARIRLAVDSTGTAALEFLDEAGHVTSRFPEAKK
jgi:hypothetical protein